MYTIEHMVISFVTGLVVGVVSSVLFSRREVTLEMTISLLIMAVWLTISTWGFFFDKEVPWLLNFAGFGAAGNFIGIKAADLGDKLNVVWRKR